MCIDGASDGALYLIADIATERGSEQSRSEWGGWVASDWEWGGATAGIHTARSAPACQAGRIQRWGAVWGDESREGPAAWGGV